MTEDIGPRLGRLRTAASERFDEHTRHEDFESMRTGRLPFPDERLALATDDARPPAPQTATDVPRLECPNAKRGAELVVKHAGSESSAIIGAVMESVQQWTGSPELQDDMTLLLARRF